MVTRLLASAGRALSRFSFMAVLAVSVLIGMAHSSNLDGRTDADKCRSITEPTARLRCFDEALRGTASPPLADSRSIGNWRLVRSSHPEGGRPVISVMRAADVAVSDPDFAGLMLRCGEAAIEVLLVVITPLPPRARPKVTLEGPDGVVLDAAVVSPGSAILLPSEATELASTAWQKHSKLAVAIAHANAQIRGIVSLDGLADAVRLLGIECQRQ